MGNLKTNRSVGLYVALTILMNFLPMILAVVIGKRLLSNSSGLAVSALGLGGGSLQSMLTDILAFLIFAWVFAVAYFIYILVLFWGVCRDMNSICGRYGLGNSMNYILVMLLSAVTLNIYYIFWSNQQGKRLKEAEGHYQRQVKGTGISHLVFALLGSVPVWVSAFFVYKLRTDPFYLMAHAGFIAGVSIAGFFLGFLDMLNRAYFIKDVNILAEAYNGQGTWEENGSRQAGEEYTMPVDDLTPDAAQAWKSKDAGMQGGYLVGCKGEYQGASIPIEGELLIGRDETSCQVVIKRQDISRKHCTIRYNGEGSYTVTDCSSNGVYDKEGNAFPKNVPVVCGFGTVLVIAKSGNEFLLK
ncbi:FHA domain-containing protein [Petralouisia muris]|uniref:FHA domain-containing protein n=1 Tax=Petralouisia muris TaxID=3032872 RepID=A0AC61S1C1_9FIRM|nr:FHA domain-containing protein [Petralouisia muris]TGY97781.1 FHA domain-containing protein [Petralouisia muris]